MIHITGFEEFAGEQAPGAALQRADYIVSGQWSIVSGRSASGISARNALLTRRAEWTTSKFSTGFAHRFDARGSIAVLKVGAKVLTLWMNPDSGMPTMNDAVGGALPVANRWYYYELEIDRASGTVALFINNKFDSYYYGFGGGLTEQSVEVSLGYNAPAAYRPGVVPVPIDNSTKTYDDFYMRDALHIGPIMVTTRFPSVDQHVEWFKSDETQAHGSILSLHPPKPLDNYVASDQIGESEHFTSIQPLANNNPVIATGVVVLARKSPSLDADLGVFIGGSVALRESARSVETGWRTQYVCFERDLADTAAAVAASEFGFNVSAP